MAKKAGRGEEPEVAQIELDPERFAATRRWVGGRGSGRRTRSCCAAASRRHNRVGRRGAGRLLEALHRLEENQQVETQASEEYDAWKAEPIAAGGRRVGDPAKQYTPLAVPEGLMNKTDPTRDNAHQVQPTVQGCNAQAAVTRGQMIIAARIAVESPDFGHPEP